MYQFFVYNAGMSRETPTVTEAFREYTNRVIESLDVHGADRRTMSEALRIAAQGLQSSDHRETMLSEAEEIMEDAKVSPEQFDPIVRSLDDLLRSYTP